jgi:hypothetical protein
VSYGLTSITLFAEIGAVYFNFVLWGISLFPAWLVLRHFGSETRPEEQLDTQQPSYSTDAVTSGEETVQVKA